MKIEENDWYMDVSENLDKDGELECDMNYERLYLSRSHAIELVKHLSKVFELSNHAPENITQDDG